VIVHAERERRRVHHLEAALDRLQVRDLGQELRVRIESRIPVVDPLDPVLRHQDRLGVDLERPQRGGRVRGEERIARSGGEDDDPLLLEMAYRPPANVGLRDLGNLDRRLDARVRPSPLERVLERECVQQGGEHARVIRCRPVHSFSGSSHATVDVPGADNDRELDALLLHLDDFPGNRVDPIAVEPVVLVAHQRLSRELQENAAEDRSRRLAGDFFGAQRH